MRIAIQPRRCYARLLFGLPALVPVLFSLWPSTASSPRPSYFPSLLHLIPLLLLSGLLVVAGCDSSVDLQPDDTDPTARTVPADSSSLTLAPMPTGSELLTPGEPAPKSNADASAYGCYLAARPFSDDVSFHSKYLHFPEEIVEAANGETKRFVYWSKASNPETTGPVNVRYANCTIPFAEGAEAVVHEQLLVVGEEEAAAKMLGENTGATSKSCYSFTRAQITCYGTLSNPYKQCETVGFDTVVFCDGGSTNDDGSNPFPDGGSGGSPPDEDGGSDESECTDRRDLNPEPGSGCEPMDPCESDNPPEHCDDEEDDITPCSEVEFEDEVDGELIRALEDKGILEDLWDKSNLDQAQRNREERGGWITLEDGEYELVEFHEAYSGIEYKPFGIRGLRSGQRPAGTVAVVHTHPFEPGEVISDEEAIRAYIEHLNAEPEDYDIESLSSNGSIVYNSEPSDNDLAGAAALQMRSYLYDGDNIVAFGASVEYGEGNEDDELILTYEEMYERCGY